MIFACLLSVYALAGLPRLPFHPDEATQLYTSRDFDLLWRAPLSMAWLPAAPPNHREKLRLLDAPLTRYWLGLGRSLAAQPALPVDWDWSLSWLANQSAGALPDSRLLWAGRLAALALYPVSLLLAYLVGRSLGGATTGLLSALLLGLNTLVLLHTRRAMAEAALLAGVLFALWSFIQGGRRPWLAGLGLAVAFNAKQSAIVLLPVGLLAVLWLPPLAAAEPAPGRRSPLVAAAISATVFLGAFALLTFVLNPVAWRAPLAAAQQAIQARQELAAAQWADTLQFAPEHALGSPPQRLAALLANLYFAPPSFAEWGNYRLETAAAEAAYLAFPGNVLLRGMAGGAIQFILALCGALFALLRLRNVTPQQRRATSLVLLTSLALVLGQLLLVPLDWQRYVIPLVPLSCLWQAYALALPLEAVQRRPSPGTPAHA